MSAQKLADTCDGLADAFEMKTFNDVAAMLRSQAAEIVRLREALENIASERHQTSKTIDIARAALEKT